jgi:hypothetical protein
MHRAALVLAMALLLPLVGSTCPAVESSISAWVAGFDHIARVRIRAIQEVADTPVGEVEVLEELKGALAGRTVYLPLRYAQRPNGEPLQVGDTGFLFAPSGEDYEATRRFWVAVDALREQAPLIESAYVMWVPVVDEKVALPAEIVLALGSEQEPFTVEGEATGLHLTPARSFMLALENALAQEPNLPKP